MPEVRPLAEAELPAAHTLFRRTLHHPPLPAGQERFSVPSYEPGRTLGAFIGDRMVGTALAWSSDLVVPGGSVLPTAAVTRVGVRADYRRRGVLRALMREQVDDFAARGEVFAALHASEPVIYGRFGYGVGTRSHRVAATRARLRPEVPRGGSVRILDPGDPCLPELYRGIRGRAGRLSRPAQWWMRYERAWALEENLVVAVHTGEDGDDGFAVWRPTHAKTETEPVTLEVEDLVAATPAVAYALWDFLVGSDLVHCVRAHMRPTDEALSAAVVDSRTVSIEDVTDDLWVRLVDVPAALGARVYGDADPVVVEVVDPFRPANDGCYRVTPDKAERAEGAAAVSVDVDVLAKLYFGAWMWSALADAGRVRVADPAALGRLDRLFAVDRPAFCGTYF
ncbi:GNAT family N-acetyltransferase [Actinokineospora sp. NPDC004072]